MSVFQTLKKKRKIITLIDICKDKISIMLKLIYDQEVVDFSFQWISPYGIPKGRTSFKKKKNSSRCDEKLLRIL